MPGMDRLWVFATDVTSSGDGAGVVAQRPRIIAHRSPQPFKTPQVDRSVGRFIRGVALAHPRHAAPRPPDPRRVVVRDAPDPRRVVVRDAPDPRRVVVRQPPDPSRTVVVNRDQPKSRGSSSVNKHHLPHITPRPHKAA
jgi:hypothetical protein